MKRMYLLVPIMLVVSLMILSMALPASANRPFQYGDLIAIMDDGRVIHIAPSGQRIDVMNVGFRMTGLADCDFDPAGNLYIATGGGGQVIRFSGPQFPRVNLGPWGTYDAEPQSIWFDNSFGAYIGLANGTQDVVYRRDLPSVDRSFDVGLENGGANWVNNGPTGQSNIIAYTSNGIAIWRYDVGADAQALDFGSLASGDIAQDFDYGSGQSPYNISVIVTRGRDVVAMDSSGTLGASIADAANAQGWFSIDSDVSQTLLPYPFFWAADTSTDSIYRFREGTPVQEMRIRPDAELGQLIGMCVYDDDDSSALPQPTPTPLPSQTLVPTETPTPLPTATFTPTATATPTGVVNQAPIIIRADEDQNIVFSGGASNRTTSLITQATDDGLPSGSLTFTWSQVSGPAAAVFETSTFNNNTLYEVEYPVDGVYVILLTVSDGELSTSRTATHNVITNQFPVANPDSLGEVTWNGTDPFFIAAADVLANDTDDGLLLPLSIVFVGDQLAPQNGIVVLVPGGIEYTPNDVCYAGSERFSYTVGDGRLPATSLISFLISPQLPPGVLQARDDSLGTAFPSQAFTITYQDLTGNDDLPTLCPELVAFDFTQPTQGTLLFDGRDLIYTPNVDAAGTDQFTYTLYDTAGQTSTATVTLQITTTVNQPPVANPDTFERDYDGEEVVTIPINNLLQNDTDDGLIAPLSFLGIGQLPAVGNLSLTSDFILYEAPECFAGEDRFTYVISDGDFQVEGQVNLLLSLVIPPPNAEDDTVGIATSGQPFIITRSDLARNDTIPRCDDTITVEFGPAANGTVVFDGTVVTYISNPGFVGEDQFTYILRNGSGEESTAQVSVIVSFSDETPEPTVTPTVVSTLAPTATATLPAGIGLEVVQVNSASDDVNQEEARLIDGNPFIWAGRGNAARTLAGLRFNAVDVPSGAIITDAYLELYSPADQWIQLDLIFTGDLSANSQPFNISLPGSRPRTFASVGYSADVYNTTGWVSFGGLTGIVQEIVNQSGWTSGNSLALLIDGLGSDWARKFYVAYELNPLQAARLVIRYQGGIEPANQAPMVNAGADQALTLPQDTIILNGFAGDDNLPLGSTLSISWMQVSGPAPVNFSNAGQAATLASFSAPGAYELRLTASDGALSSTDSLIVTVNPQPTSYAILALPISAPTDDVNQEGTTLVDGSATVFFGRGNATPSLTGLRFTGVNLPPGAVIADAWLTVYSPFDQWIEVDIEVAGDLSANSLPFTSSALPGDRPRTSNRVSSSTNRLTPTGWASYTGLAGIVQEIVNQADWAAGNSLTLVIEGRGGDWARKFFTAFEADPTLAPQLMIAWYLPDPTPVPPTTEPTVEAPVEATPTAEPSLEPTVEPTASPTLEPTVEPTLEPTIEPTTTPVPTELPPTSTPTPEPTLALLPTVTISADVLVGTAPLMVQFSSVVTDASAYAWDFGDGVGVSLEANPVYTFTTPGTYTVTLVVSGPGGLASSTLSITVQ